MEKTGFISCGITNHSEVLCLDLRKIVHVLLCFKMLTLSQTRPFFLRVCSKSLLKTLKEKEKLLVTSNFSFSHSVLNPFGELSTIFTKFEIIICKLFQFGRIQIVFENGLNSRYIIITKEIKTSVTFL